MTTAHSGTPKRLFRFRPLDDSVLSRELEALRDNYVWSPRLSDMNDPMEAFYELGDHRDQVLRDILPVIAPQLDETYERMRQTLSEWGLISMSTTHLNYPMWAYYASSFKGMCLEFDTELLNTGDLYREPLKQVDYDNTPPPAITLVELPDPGFERVVELLIRKRKEWAHEQEWRYITGSGGRKHYHDGALCRVYIGPRAEDVVVQRVTQALKNRPVEILLGSVVGFDIQFNTNSIPKKELP